MDLVGFLQQLSPAAAKLIPKHITFQLESYLSHRSASAGLSQNHDLLRAYRFAWTDAARIVAKATQGIVAAKSNPTNADDDAVTFCNLVLEKCAKIHANAAKQDQNQELLTTAIDRCALPAMAGVHMYIGNSGVEECEQEINKQLGALLADLTGWTDNEIPRQFMNIARSGLGDTDKVRRSFGMLVIHGLGEILKSDSYPEAKAAYGIWLHDLSVTILNDHKEKLERIEVSVDKVLALLDPETITKNLFKGAVEVVNSKEKHFPPAREDTVFLYYQGVNARWKDTVTEAFAKVLDRNDTKKQAALYPWDMEKLETVLRGQTGESSAEFLQSFAGMKRGKSGLATIIDLRNGLGPMVEGTQKLWDELRKSGLLASGDDAGIRGNWPEGGFDRSEALNKGQVPLCVPVIACVRALASGTPLVLCFDGRDQSSESAAMLALFGKGAIKVDTGAGVSPREWLTDLLVKAEIIAKSETSPFRFLDYYDTEDSACYFGRDTESETVCNLILSQDTDIVGVTGVSGSGKSSFLRAGVIGRLGADVATCVVLRSSDFEPCPMGALKTLADLLAMIGEKTGHAAPEALTASLRASGSAGREEAVIDAIKSLQKGRAARLVICLDQFEEIIDELHDGKNKPEWRALIDVLQRLTGAGVCKLLFTLEDTRLERFEAMKGELGLAGAELVNLPPIDRSFLETVIAGLFRTKGYRVDKGLLTSLADSVLTPKQKNFRGSMIPLLSLKLSRIYERLQSDAALNAPDSQGSKAFDKAAATGVIDDEVLARLDISLDLVSEIDQLAEEAWNSCNPEEDHIGPFLRPLIRVSPGNGDVNIVLNVCQNRAFEADNKFDTAFRDARLLVPVGSGHRLVHEVVIHEWKRAAAWFEKENKELRTEAEFREKAQRWHHKGRPLKKVWKKKRRIRDAAVILGNWMRNWAVDGHRIDDETDANLKDYCLAVFSHDRAPRTILRNSEKDSAHVHIAASFGMVDLLKRYHESDPESLHLKRKDGAFALHQAAFSHPEAVAFLLECGLDPHIPEENGHIALTAPSFDKRVDVFEVLLAATDPQKAMNPGVVNPVLSFAATRCPDMLKKAVAAGFDPNFIGKFDLLPLLDAARTGDVESFAFLLERSDPGAVDVNGWNMAHRAAESNNVGVLDIITTTQGLIPLAGAANPEGWTPLMFAASRQHADSIEKLLYAGRPEAKRDDGFRALHHAIAPIFNPKAPLGWRKKIAVRRAVAALLENASLDVNARTKKGQSPYMMAAADPDLQKMLEAHGKFDPLSREKNAWNALMIAARKGDADKVNALLEQPDTDLAYVGLDGNSVMNCLVKGNLPDIFERLWDAARIDPWNEQAQRSGLLATLVSKKAWPMVTRLCDAAPATASPDALNKALNAAAVAGAELDLFKKLVALGARPSQTTLVASVRHAHIALCRHMLESGVNPEVENSFDRPLYDLAPDHAYAQVKELVENLPECNQALFDAALKGDEARYTVELIASSYLELLKTDGFDRLPYEVAPDAFADRFKEQYTSELEKKAP